MELFTLKLITRSWWRNKIFFFISLLSLSIGLACTNLLLTFFIYEYNIESNLPDKEQIVCLQQDAPMQEGAKVSYAVGTIPALLKDKFAEIEEYVRINTMSAQYCKYNTEVFHDVTFICADASLLCFFDYQTRTGNLKEVLIHPDQVAVSEEFAQKMFGDTDPIDKHIDVSMSDNGNKTYVVKAVIKARPQSLLRFDLITGTESTFWGGFTLLKLTEGSSPQSLADKINNESIPTLLPGEGRYYLKPFSEIYFSTSGKTSQESLSYIRQSNVQLLYICLLSAFLIFAMACFNYTNMNLSRTLQQLKMIHIEKLMGNTLTGIRKQLFGDIFLTVFFAFILSLLFISDILPYFNGLLDAHLHISFFFSTQVLPWLLLFILITAIAPGAYISHKLSRISARASYLQLKIKPENRKETLSAIRQGWEKINGGEVFDYQDMHQVFMERNKEVLTLSQILMNYSLIGLLLVSFGLFGIFWYTVRQRIREISIRKIHGATFRQVIWLFSKPFFLQIGISYILAIPVAYWLMKTWKEQFAYSTGWSLWIFLLPLFIVVGISIIVISLHCYLAVKLNPTVTMKQE